LSEQAQIEWAERTGNPRDNYGVPRTDPILIEMVEQDSGWTSGMGARLKVIEIPDDVAWEISEYDGYEEVHEVHRSWS
jgi:hypothetical protein